MQTRVIVCEKPTADAKQTTIEAAIAAVGVNARMGTGTMDRLIEPVGRIPRCPPYCCCFV